MVPLVYSPAYNITAFGLERLHPFDSRKYRRIRDWLIWQGLRQPDNFVAPRPCTSADLLRVHAPSTCAPCAIGACWLASSKCPSSATCPPG